MGLSILLVIHTIGVLKHLNWFAGQAQNLGGKAQNAASSVTDSIGSGAQSLKETVTVSCFYI